MLYLHFKEKEYPLKMKNFYARHDRLYVAIDSVIFGFDGEQLMLLLIRRNFEPGKGSWSLMGGFVKKEESVDEAASRILYALTGLKDIYMEQLHCYGDPLRDPGARTISIAYYALIKVNEYDRERVSRHNARWFSIQSIPALVFDHNRMVNDALEALRQKAKHQPIGFELLPEKFTLPQLKKLYDAIYQKNFDKRNFSKKILSMGILERLNEKVKNHSIRPASLYRFDRKRYKQLLKEGFHFGI